MRLTVRILLALLALAATPALGVVPTATSLSGPYSCDGSTTVAFTAGFKFFASSDLVVKTKTAAGVEATLAYATDYTVTGAGGSSGTVTLVAASKCPNLSTLTIERTVALTQTTPFSQQGSFNPKTHENGFDRGAMADQQLDRKIATNTGRIGELQAELDAEEATRAAADTAATSDRAAIRSELAAGDAADRDFATTLANGILAGTGVVPQEWSATGDGATLRFPIAGAELSSAAMYLVTLSGVTQRPTTDYSIDLATDEVVFTTAPGLGVPVAVRAFGYSRGLNEADTSLVTATGSTTARALKDRFSDVVNVKDFGAWGDGVTDDTAALQAALNAGGKVVDFASGTFLTSACLRVTMSGQTLLGLGATIATVGADTDAICVGQNAGGAFVKTDDVTIDGFVLVGQADGLAGHDPAAILVRAPAANPYTEGAGCSRIKIANVQESGFAYGVAATGADSLTVTGSKFGGNWYLPAVNAGGYGILLQTVFTADITDNRFVGGPHDRHAIYVSVDPSRSASEENVCRDVTVAKNKIDWRGVVGGLQCVAVGVACSGTGVPTGFEVAVNVRAPDVFSFTSNTVRGGYGGISYDAANGNGSDVVISGNAFSEGAVLVSERSAVQFTRSSADPYSTSGVSISGNTISEFTTNPAPSHGISLSYVTDASVSGNSIRINGVAAITFGGSVNYVAVAGNRIKATSADAFMFTGVNDGVTIGRNEVGVASGILHRFYANPTNLRFGYPRCARVTADGVGGVTIVSDPEAILTSVASDAFGVAATFSPAVTGDYLTKTWATARNSNVANIYNRSVTTDTQVFGVSGLSGGVLAPLPAASNAYSLNVCAAE